MSWMVFVVALDSLVPALKLFRSSHICLHFLFFGSCFFVIGFFFHYPTIHGILCATELVKVTNCWIVFLCWRDFFGTDTSFKKRPCWIFCVVYWCLLYFMAPPYNDKVIHSIPIWENQTTKATWQFAAFRSTKKNLPRMGNKPSFQCWVDIEGMNDINDVSIIHKWMTCFLFCSTGSKLVQSRFSVNFSFQSALQ